MVEEESHPAKRLKANFYSGKVILAPMVRENNLPFRMLCRHYGADIVYTEELIDHKLIECRRLVNKVLGTVDYVDKAGEIILRTCPSEKEYLILQIGSNNPDRAIEAAKVISQDVAGLDFNFGCPKSFSLSGGMGAALLERPQQIESLLKRAVEQLDIPVTCKIRVLPDLDKTLQLVKMVEQCGVAAIAVHGRTKDQRPRHENRNEFLKKIADSLVIPMIANGGSNHIKTHADIMKFKEATNASSVMIARAAMRNPSIFKSDGVLEPINKVICEFVKYAVRYDNYVANTKYTIQYMLPAGQFGPDFVSKFHAAGDFKALCDIFNLSDWFDSNRLTKSKDDFYESKQVYDKNLEQFVVEKQKELESMNMKFICDSLPYHQRIYGKESPKSQLMSFLNKQHVKLDNQIFQLDTDSNKHRYYCMIIYDNTCYFNKSLANGKKGAEHATAMLVCEHLKLIDLSEYKSRVNGTSRNISS